MATSSQALDLYAKVEDLLGVREVSPKLYAHYLLALQEYEFSSLLDVGCGSGEFIFQLSKAFPNAKMQGVDLSCEMVNQALKLGVDAKCIDLCNIDKKYDVITCVFDMLNYLSFKELPTFLNCLKARLNSGGLLLCDINTLYGFKEVAVGAFVAEDSNRFISIESDFEDGVYEAYFTLFEKKGQSCWQKSSQTIKQYYHLEQEIEKLLDARVIYKEDIALYGDRADKYFLIYEC